MLYVIIALLPASIFGVYNFGLRALLLIAVCIASCVASEWIFEKIVHKKSTITDFSAVLTGLLLALNLPHTLPIWQAVLGSIFAIVIVKMLFGGLGQNFMNPALAGRCFMMLSFSSAMTSFTVKKGAAYMYGVAVDATSSATPLAQVKEGGLPDLKAMFLGTTTGTIGETSAIAILIGAMFLILMGVITLRIPGTYIITFVIFISLFGGHGFDPAYVTAQVAGGGLMLGAIFMATDYQTSPINNKGKAFFALGCGILTFVIREYCAYPEGVSLSILVMNILAPMIEKWTAATPLGLGGPKNAK